MSTDPANTTFDDPSLRKALRTQLGRETAPSSLRARVLAALDDAEATAPVRSATRPEKSNFFLGSMGRLAMAASVLIVIGIGITIAMRSGGSKTHPIAVLPAPFAQAMATRHDSTEIRELTKSDLPTMTKQFRDELGFPPLVAMLEGWQFEGGRVTDIASVKSAHLYFTRGDQSLSIFSIPGKAVYSPEDGARYQVTVDQHPIAGFVKGTTMYCIVGKSEKGELTLAQVQSIVESLEKRL